MEFRLGQFEYGKDASTSSKPKAIFAQGVSVKAPLISRLFTATKHRATTSCCKSTNNRIPDSRAAHVLTRGSCRIPRESLQVTASLPHACPAPSSFHSQDMVAPWVRVRLNARSHSDSNCQPLHIRRCLRLIRPQQKTVDRLDSPPSLARQARDERPWNMS